MVSRSFSVYANLKTAPARIPSGPVPCGSGAWDPEFL